MVKLINKLKNRKGFTLIELIVVLAVLAIITAIAAPRFIGVQSAAAVKADLSTIDMIKRAAELYYVSENVEGVDEGVDLKDLVGSGYIDEIEWQSDEVTGVTITFDENGVATVTTTPEIK